MQIVINVSEDGKVTTEIQQAKSAGESAVYFPPPSAEAPLPISQAALGESHDGGAAPVGLEEGATPQEASLTTELGDLDAGGGPRD